MDIKSTFSTGWLNIPQLTAYSCYKKLIVHQLDYSVNKEVKDNNGRILILDEEIQGKPYLITNL